MILIIDNYDSFTYNIVEYLNLLNQSCKVIKNDAVSIKDIRLSDSDSIILTPGPGRPEKAGITLDVIHQFKKHHPILGICLGHEAIGLYFGGKIIHAPRICHGNTSMIEHDNQGVFYQCNNPFLATRYHSLIVDNITAKTTLKVSAWTKEHQNTIIMGLRHQHYLIESIQFHPESILTENGIKILQNFIKNQ